MTSWFLTSISLQFWFMEPWTFDLSTLDFVIIDLLIFDLWIPALLIHRVLILWSFDSWPLNPWPVDRWPLNPWLADPWPLDPQTVPEVVPEYPEREMANDDLVYAVVLVGSVFCGMAVSSIRSPGLRQLFCGAVGATSVAVICGINGLHSMLMALVNGFIVTRISSR